MQLTYIKRINIMENNIEILIRQNKILMQQLLRLSEDLELANERIDKLEKPKEAEGEKTKCLHMRILSHI
jgi:hypothetical protein